MASEVSFVHASANLLSPTILEDAASGRPRHRAFHADTFAPPLGQVPTQAKVAEDMEAAYRLAQERYDAVRTRLRDLITPEVRERWLIPLLQLLDFDPVFQRQHLQASPIDKRTFAITHLGWDTPEAPPLVLVAEDLDSPPGPRRRSPHDELQQFLNLSPSHDWGIAANMAELRLIRDFHHARLKAFVSFDLRGIFESLDFDGFRALYRLCHASRFIPVPGEEHKRPILDELFEDSQREGVQVGKLLRPGVVEAITTTANGVATPELWQRIRAGGEPARAFFRELLYFVYRVLFCFFAEQRGLLPNDGIYAESYSLTGLREVAERRLADPSKADLFEGLKATFRLLQQGAPSIGVYPYNGPLFDPSQTPTLNQAKLSNRHLVKALLALTTVRIEGVKQHVDFGHLGVDELGSVYESLLPYALRIADKSKLVESRPVEPGQAYLDPVSTERGDLGAYYTRPELVDFVLEVSLDKLIAERLEAAGEEPATQERAVLDINVIDPACGSGTFLVGAVDRLAAAVAGARAGGEKPTEEALQRSRREVLQHCVYGVDKDLFAVELCRVALWIHCAVKDLPLTFLDHRIQHGDSLVGWGPGEVSTEIPIEAYAAPTKADKELKTFLKSARERNKAVLEGQGELGVEHPAPVVDVPLPDLGPDEEAGLDDIHRKAERFAEYLASPEYRRWKAAADIWTAAFFWGLESSRPPTSADYWKALEGRADPELATRAAEIADVFPALHWSLRFPEVYRAGGFDGVIGNPPWEQFESREEDWWSAAGYPEIAEAHGATRKSLIEKTTAEDPEIRDRWRRFEQANSRLADYSRTCGRFTEPGGKANTYLLFAELAADLLAPRGRAGIVVKSALALDKGAQSLFQRLLNGGQIEELHDTLNRGPGAGGRVFPAVADVERFAVVGLRSGGEPLFDATVMNWNLDEARTRPRQPFTTRILETLNPTTRSLTSFRTAEELEVAVVIHRSFPMLDFEKGTGNPWGLSYHTLFNSTTDSHLFLRREGLEADGWTLARERIFRRNGEEALPVYEGQLVNRYDHRARTYEGYKGKNKYGRKPNAPWTTDAQKSSFHFEAEPRYWMASDHAENRLRRTVGHSLIIGFGNASRPWTDQRSATGAMIPRRPATDGLPVLGIRAERGLEFLALFNSTTFDFLVRGHMPGPNLKAVWMLSQIAVPEPGLDPMIAEAAERLTLTSYSVASLFGKEPYRWDPRERYELDVWLDSMIAHAYKLTKEQYEVILDSFEVMAREETRKHGYYKFKSDCLAAYTASR